MGLFDAKTLGEETGLSIDSVHVPVSETHLSHLEAKTFEKKEIKVARPEERTYHPANPIKEGKRPEEGKFLFKLNSLPAKIGAAIASVAAIIAAGAVTYLAVDFFF